MVRLRCEVRLDVLYAMCAQLATNLKKMKWFQKALSLGFLLRFNVADGTFDLPLDAIRELIPRGSDGVEAGRVSSGGTSWLNQTHEQVRKYIFEVRVYRSPGDR